MSKDYPQLWKTVTSTSDEGRAVRTLVEIVVDKEGKTFVLNLERKDATAVSSCAFGHRQDRTPSKSPCTVPRLCTYSNPFAASAS